jgi:hypothetical protein
MHDDGIFDDEMKMFESNESIKCINKNVVCRILCSSNSEGQNILYEEPGRKTYHAAPTMAQYADGPPDDSTASTCNHSTKTSPLFLFRLSDKAETGKGTTNQAIPAQIQI